MTDVELLLTLNEEELLNVYEQVAKHIEYLEGSIISQEEESEEDE